MGETTNNSNVLLRWCVGCGVDLGHGGDPIHDGALRIDLPVPYTKVGSYPGQWSGDARCLYWFKDGALDYVYSSHLLEDFDDTYVVLREWLRVLRLGGFLVLNCPHEGRFRAHCFSTGQGLNAAHKHINFSLDFVKTYLERLGVEEFPFEEPNAGPYSFLLVARKGCKAWAHRG